MDIITLSLIIIKFPIKIIEYIWGFIMHIFTYRDREKNLEVKIKNFEIEKKAFDLEKKTLDIEKKSLELQFQQHEFNEQINKSQAWEKEKILYKEYKMPGGATVYAHVCERIPLELFCPVCFKSESIMHLESPVFSAFGEMICQKCHREFR